LSDGLPSPRHTCDAADTIFALASGAGRGAISVVRLSGAGAGIVLKNLCETLPKPRQAALRLLRDASGNMLDRALVLWMPGPASYTGEDVAELHLHGGRAVLSAVTRTLLGQGARPAEPGEFTRRAFLAGRMDLLEAEAIADLVNAETEAQRRQALRQMSGALGARLSGWSARLRHILAFQEALIDFPDEDLPSNVEAGLLADLRALAAEIAAEIARAPDAERLREGVVVTIVGAPNVGKSSLLNALAKRDVAIIAATPGTTRDALEVRIDLGGVPVTLIDTAGLRETEDPVEKEGIRRARASAASADLVLCLVDARCPEEFPEADITIANKTDLAPPPQGMPGVSVLTGDGLRKLEDLLSNAVAHLTNTGTDPVFTRARHAAAARDAAAALSRAERSGLPELRAENLRLALNSLARITGAVDAEAILDDVFANFCIGK
jgi:tRNA modification GTPase